MDGNFEEQPPLNYFCIGSCIVASLPGKEPNNPIMQTAVEPAMCHCVWG